MEGRKMGNDATHAFCKKCSEVQPILWQSFKSITVQGDKSREFTGMDATCEVCGFEIAKVGSLGPVNFLVYD